MLKKGLIIAAAAVALLAGCQQGVSKAKLESGKKIYVMYCQSCHMEDGNGVPNLNAPLVASKYIAGDNQKLISVVLKGSAAIANDPGREEYKNTMPSMALLNDNEIADLLTWLRNSFENKGPEIKPDEVRSVREKMN